ncbi:DUF4123 domain-containing protein [Cupriavidus sp. 2TAF22]|uniref:DUF4123 domain-containing protein n=1 Tax=unclassified Cupriavidus TaxID=2640874 RepID=UPI003F8EEA9F
MTAGGQTLAGWPRQRVRGVQEPAWHDMPDMPRRWLWLDGAENADLEAEVRAITGRFDHQWIWRETEREYQPPGYRHGPLLVPLDKALLEHFLAHWAPRQAGLLLFSRDDDAGLLGHLQQLHQLIAADGLPLFYSLGAPRALEELCEGLPAPRLAETLGPIQTLVWRTPEEQGGQWLCADNPDAHAPALSPRHHVALTSEDEAALGHASHAWFMRDNVRHFTRLHAAFADPANQQELCRQLTAFATEAEKLALTLERDVRHYMALRLAYPQAPFATDAELRAGLTQRHMAGLQRLHALEDRLRRISPIPEKGPST